MNMKVKITLQNKTEIKDILNLRKFAILEVLKYSVLFFHTLSYFSFLYYPIILLIFIYETTNNPAPFYYHFTFNNFMERRELCSRLTSFKAKY